MKKFPWVFVLAWVLSTLFCIAFVDRAASTWSHDHLHAYRSLFNPLTLIVDPIPPAALIALAVVAAVAFRPGWKPNDRWRLLFCGGISILVAIEFKEKLKYLFGRTWPETWVANNPSWISNHVFGFDFRHGGEGWYSFPSGHMTITCALGATLWLHSHRTRWLAVLLPVLVAIGLFGCDYHWTSDMVAGTFLGTATANFVWLMYSKIQESRPDSN